MNIDFGLRKRRPPINRPAAMCAHWTYSPVVDAQVDLEQGDILRTTHALARIFEKVHPHFLDPKYLGFIVTTQTCDLVRRKTRGCRADYINLCVIRDLKSVLVKFLDRECTRVGEGAYDVRSRQRAHELIERILNQNEQSIGVFYLHDDPDRTGIGDKAVALLRVGIAVRADQHYETLLEARSCRLNPEFRNKLGWLVGNLYSRVATPDWAEREGGKTQSEAIRKQLLDSSRFHWLPKAIIDEAEKQQVPLSQLPRSELIVAISQLKPVTQKERLLKAIERTARKLIEDKYEQSATDEMEKLLGEFVQGLLKRLQNNAEFSQVARHAENGYNNTQE